MTWRRILGLLLIGAGLLVLTLKLAHVFDPAPAAGRLAAKMSAKASPRIAQAIGRVAPAKAAYALLIIVPMGLGGMLLLTSFGKKRAVGAEPATANAELKDWLKAR